PGRDALVAGDVALGGGGREAGADRTERRGKVHAAAGAEWHPAPAGRRGAGVRTDTRRRLGAGDPRAGGAAVLEPGRPAVLADRVRGRGVRAAAHGAASG